MSVPGPFTGPFMGIIFPTPESPSEDVASFNSGDYTGYTTVRFISSSFFTIGIGVLFLPPSSPVCFIPLLVVRVFAPRYAFFLDVIRFNLRGGVRDQV